MARQSEIDFASIGEGFSLQRPLLISQKEMNAFAELSGDHNPVHLDATFARARGFQGEVVYGGLLVAAISRLIGMELPGAGCLWHTLAIRFRKPLYVNEKAELTATVSYISHELRTLRLHITISRGADLLCDGDVQAALTTETSA